MKLRKKAKIIYNGIFGPYPHPEKWVFIVGCYNSGTTLLHDLLAAHPQIGTLPKEGQFLTNQLTTPKSVDLPRLWALEPDRFYLSDHDNKTINVNKIKRQWGSNFNDPTKPVLIEKSPTNAARTKWLQENFENPYFIGIIRDCYAVAEGIRRKAGHSLEHCAIQWVKSNEIMLRDFESLNNQTIIRYEDLTEDPERILQEIIEFLGLDRLDVNVSGKKWRIHERTSSIENMNQYSFSRLSDQDFATINNTAVVMLSKLGYETLKVLPDE